MIQLNLYTTLGCHLCDQARGVVERVLAQQSYRLNAIEIADSEQLSHRYGVRIPVLQAAHAPSHELGWPFDEAGFAAWLQNLPDTQR